MAENISCGKRMGLNYFTSALGVVAALTTACAHNKTMAKARAPEAAHAPAKVAAGAAPATAIKPVETFAQLAHGLAIHKFWGVVESIDPAEDSLDVKSRSGRVKDFEVLSDTALNKGGDDVAVKFSDIKTGERLRVIYAGKYAKAIHVMVPASHSG